MTPSQTKNDSAFSVNPFAPPKGDVDSLSDLASTTPRRRRRADNRNRDRSAPVLVEATVHWWRTDELRAACSSNQFGVMPTTPVRFRCIGSLTPKFPKRYRIDLALALDWLQELSQRELKGLGASLLEAVATKLGVDVALISCEVMDLDSIPADGP